MIYIIEPHPDDAFMSLHAHITGPWKDEAKVIVTVTGNEERLNEAQSYAKSTGCLWRSLGYKDSEWDKNDNGIGALEEWQLPWYKAIFVFPLGLRHPDHIKVANMVSEVAADIHIWRYLDAYYVQSDTNPDMQAALVGKTIVSAMWALESKRFYVSRFPSQSFRMLAIQPSYPPRFELVVR